MIADLLVRYKHLVDLATDPKVFPPVDVYNELAAEWYHVSNPTKGQREAIMLRLKTELERQTLWQAMNEKFHHPP